MKKLLFTFAVALCTLAAQAHPGPRHGGGGHGGHHSGQHGHGGCHAGRGSR